MGQKQSKHKSGSEIASKAAPHDDSSAILESKNYFIGEEVVFSIDI